MSYVCSNLITSEGDYGSHDKRLSICLAANGFSFSETTASGLILTFGQAEGEHATTITEATREIKSFFTAIGINALGYASSQLIVPSEDHVWVPDELYVPSANRLYLGLVGSKATSVVSVPGKAIGATAVFAANDQLLTAFKVAMPGINVVSQHVKMLQFMPRSADHPVIASNWREGRVDIAIMDKGSYLYGNTLSFRSTDDALFLTVELMKQHGADGSKTEILMMGNVEREMFARFRPYFPVVTLYSGEAVNFSSPRFKSLRTYRHALLFM